MRKLVAGALFASAVTAGAVGLSASPAFAASWTTSPGGAWTAQTSTTGTTVLRASTGATITCSPGSGLRASTAAGTLQTSDADGIGLGSITSVRFNNCRGPLNISFTVTAALPWSINAGSYNSGTGVTTGSVSGISATLSGPGCTATATGTVPGTFTNSTDVLALNGGGLTISGVSGCFGLINNGNSATFQGSYTVTPGQTITSP